MTESPQELSKLKQYEVALQTRNFEISLFWQRSNYFLVLNGAVATGFFSLRDHTFAPLLSLAGFAAASLWFAINLGGKYWQARWEYRLYLLEKELGTNIDLFSASWETMDADVKASLEFDKHRPWRKVLDDLILVKPSVSLVMTLLSIFFMLFWAIALVTSGCGTT